MPRPSPERIFPWRVAFSLGFFATFLYALYIKEYLAAVFIGAATGYIAAAPIVSVLLEIPAFMRWWRYHEWQGYYIAYERLQIRALPAEHADAHYTVAIADVEQAVGRSLGRFSDEFTPTTGLLRGLRCVPADSLLPVLEILQRSGQPHQREQARHFSLWLQKSLLAPVNKARDQATRAIQQGNRIR